MPRDEAYLLDILNAARTIQKYISGKTFFEFLADSQCQDAVMRRLEIIGEAARRISEEFQNEHGLPWSLMIGMRNFIIHQYDSVDLNIVWDTVQNDIPRLVAAIEKIPPL